MGMLLGGVRAVWLVRAAIKEPAAHSTVWRDRFSRTHPNSGDHFVFWHPIPRDQPLPRRAELGTTGAASAR